MQPASYIYIVCFFNILVKWQPGQPAVPGPWLLHAGTTRLMRDGNFYVIAFCLVGSGTRVERLNDSSLYSIINT